VLSETQTDQSPDRSRDYKQHLRVGGFRVDPGALVVQSGDDTVRLKPKAMAVLLELARQPGITVSREELLDRVWESTYITPGVVGHAITALRRAFGDQLEQPAYIETIPRIGYRLIAPVERIGSTHPVEGSTDQPPPVPGGNEPGIDQLPSQEHVRAARTPWRVALLVLAATTILLAMFTAAWWFARPAPAGGIVKVTDVHRITFATGSENNPRLNAAGDWLVYARTARLGARPELTLQSAYGTEPILLAQGDHAERPAWSPQGRSVAYVWRDQKRCEIRITNIDDRSRQTVAACPKDSVVYLDWSSNDDHLMAYTAVEPAQTGGARLQLLRDQGGWHPVAFDYERGANNLDLYPRFSPDGRRIAFRRGSNPSSDIYLVSVNGGRVERLTEVRSTITGFDWLPDSSGLVFASDHDGRQELYSVALADHTVRPLDLVDASSPDIAAHAWRMSFQMEDWRSTLTEVPLHAGAEPRPLAPSSGRDQAAALSPDGRRVVFVSDRDGSSQLWSLDRSSGKTERLTDHPGVRVDMPTISPDGQRVMYTTRSRGHQELWEYRFSDEVRRRISAIPMSLRNAIYAGDGRSLWYVAWQGKRWALYRCERGSADQACNGKETPLSALRVERSRLAGVDVLVLASTVTAGGLEIVTEQGLRSLRDVTLPPNDRWTVVDDAVWSLHATDAPDDDDIALNSTSLLDGTTRELARLSGLRPLGLTPFQATPDRKSLVLPTVTANSSDVGFARLVDPAAR
jgi:Tol biopolymer transport system component/DNA-binding winged helix-turn-helix (wHTH) protein